eukprot:scaffold3887_cov214-Pinguiococcus_pyrenoidosus.AAC.2
MPWYFRLNARITPLRAVRSSPRNLRAEQNLSSVVFLDASRSPRRRRGRRGTAPRCSRERGAPSAPSQVGQSTAPAAQADLSRRGLRKAATRRGRQPTSEEQFRSAPLGPLKREGHHEALPDAQGSGRPETQSQAGRGRPHGAHQAQVREGVVVMIIAALLMG